MRTWYCERYDPKSTKPKWSGRLPDIDSVLAMILRVRTECSDDIVRVLGPHDALPNDLRRLLEVGAEPT